MLVYKNIIRCYKNYQFLINANFGEKNMKNILRKIFIVVFALGFLASSSTALAATPAYVSQSAGSMTQTSATLNASYNPKGLPTYGWFELQNNSNKYGYQNLGSGNSNVAFNYTLGNLTANTSYTFRSVAENTTGTTYGSWMTFTTNSGNTGGGCTHCCYNNCNPNPTPAPTVYITASPTYVYSGNDVVLNWSSTNATSCTSNWGGNTTSGSRTVYPTSSRSYSITCTGAGGSATDSAYVTVNQVTYQAPVINLYASPTSVAYGGTTNLTWNVSNATSCVASNGWTGNKNANGGTQSIGNMTAGTTFVLTCTGQGGSASDSTFVSVASQPVNPPTVSLYASPTSVAYGGTTNLTWNVSNATSCVASNGWTGNKNANGGTQSIGNMTAGTTFVLTCTGQGGSASDSTFVSVASQPVNPPTVSLYASPTSVAYGGTTNLTWNVSNATSCVASNGWTGNKNANGGTQSIGNMTAGTTFVLTCTGQGGSASDSTFVSVAQQNILPTVTTNPATGIGTNYALLNGNVSANGNSPVTAWFEWGTNGNMTNQTNQVNYGTANNTNYSYSLGGLQSNTTYYFRAVAQNTNGQMVYGNQMTFTTQGNTGCTFNCGNYGNPNVTTYNATEITQNTAVLNGYVETNGNFTIRWFEYGTSGSFLPSQTNKLNQGTNSGNFNQLITNLQPNTTYYFRAVAQGNGQTVYGNVLNFSTSFGNNNSCNFGNCAPTAVTTLATNVDNNSARLNGLGLVNGNVNTNGYFEYGTTTALGRTTNTGFIGNSPSSPFYSSLFGLTPNTTYYFRAVVNNEYGTSRGDIQTFRTLSGGTVSGVSTTNTVTRYVYREVIPVVNTISTTNITEGVGLSKASLVFLTINRNNEIVNLGNTIDYTINYKNVSSEHLKDLVLRVLIPKEFTFVNASRGYLGDDNQTLVVNIDNLYPQEEGSVVLRVEVNNDATVGKTVVTTANMVYTITKNNLQEEVFAYSKNIIEPGNYRLVGGALFGNGFWPTTLIGWLLLVLIILLIILAIRIAYTRTVRRN